MTASAGIGSIASPTLTVRSYCRIACKSGRTTATPGPRRRSQGARSSISWSMTSRIMPPSISWQLDFFVTSAAASGGFHAQQPADDLAGVAREAWQRRQPLELAPDQPFGGPRRTSASSRGSSPSAPWSAG